MASVNILWFIDWRLNILPTFKVHYVAIFQKRVLLKDKVGVESQCDNQSRLTPLALGPDKIGHLVKWGVNFNPRTATERCPMKLIHPLALG